MKKKNIFKKLMSVILSAATMFSLLTLPAHAVVPGGDAYSITTTTMYRYYCDTQQIEQFEISNDDDMFPGTSTYDFLDYDQLPNGYNNGDVDMQVIIGSDDRQPLPPSPFWNMTVLILIGIDTDNDFTANKYSVGSGFLVDENVMVTAMHSICPNGISEDQITSAVIYHGIDSQQISYDVATLIANKESAHITSVTYDPRYFIALEAGGYNEAYDWCVVTLDEEIDSYYLDCDIAISSIEGCSAGVIGYPQDYFIEDDDETNDRYQFWRRIGMGEVISYDGVMLTHDADTKGGQSGGPLLTDDLTSVAVGYGIHISGDSRTDEFGNEIGMENYARAITPEIYNTIVTIMEDSW